jgi:hypothetical protein
MRHPLFSLSLCPLPFLCLSFLRIRRRNSGHSSFRLNPFPRRSVIRVVSASLARLALGLYICRTETHQECLFGRRFLNMHSVPNRDRNRKDLQLNVLPAEALYCFPLFYGVRRLDGEDGLDLRSSSFNMLSSACDEAGAPFSSRTSVHLLNNHSS